MNLKEGLLLLWILAVMACCFFITHFSSFTLDALQKAIMFGLLPLLAVSKVGGIAGIHFSA